METVYKRKFRKNKLKEAKLSLKKDSIMFAGKPNASIGASAGQFYIFLNGGNAYEFITPKGITSNIDYRDEKKVSKIAIKVAKYIEKVVNEEFSKEFSK